MSPSKPSIPLSKVPSVKQLCELLGFQHASLKDTNEFMEATRAWRKFFKASSGRDASKLLQWKDTEDQLDLEEMAQNFLNHKGDEDEGNGERFWSNKRSWNRDSDLQFPEDRAEIVLLLKQLFWKQNRYAYNNLQYGHKAIELRDGVSEKSPSISEAIEKPVVMGQVTEKLTEKVPEKVPEHVKDHASLLISKTLTGTTENITQVHTSTVTKPKDQGADIYEVPDDSDYEQSHSLKHRRTKAGPNEQRRKRKKPNPTTPTRRTERLRTTRNIEGNVPDDQIVQVIQEQEAEAYNPTKDAQKAQPSQKLVLESSTSQHHFDKGTDIGGQLSYKKPFAAPIAPMDISMRPESISPSPNSTKTTPKVRMPLQNHCKPVHQSQFQGHDIRPTESLPPGTGHLQASIMQPNSQLLLEVKRALNLPNSFPEPTDRLARPRSPKQLPRSVTSDIVVVSSSPSHVGAQEMSKSSPGASRVVGSPRFETQQSHESINTEKPLHIQEDMTTGEILEEDNATEHSVPHPRTEIRQRSQGLLPQNPSSKPRTKTLVPLWIITREPRYTEERWDEGKFQGTPLSTFIEGVSKVTQRGHIEKIKLTLRAPTFDTKITVFKDAEDSWESAKETFVEKLRESKAEARARRQSESLNFKILVEPCYEEGSFFSESVHEDEDEFEF